MAKRKEKLLDKLVKRDYNNDLEEVLAKKKFPEEVKNLLLDILYKIDDSYKDYETVKKNVISKQEYVESIIRSVRNNCESIEFIKPDEEQKKTFIVDKENKQIQCYPIIQKLLYCLAKIQKSDNIIKVETELLNKTLTNLINVGNNINTVEPIRDFNGFSWDISVLDIENFYYNIVYQDLIILVGNRLIEEWANKNDVMVDYAELFKSDLEKKYGKKISKEILELLKTISVLLELTVNKEFKEEMQDRRKEVEQELNNMENKEEYLDNLSKKKKMYTKQIRNIDITLNDKEKLAIEYEERNKNLPLEQKIFSKRVLMKKLEEERDEFMFQMQECNKKMNSTNFLQTQKDLKQELKYLELESIEDAEKAALEKIILLQKRVLQALSLKIKKAKTKEKIVKIIYEIRYFNLIPIDRVRNIGKIPKLKKMLTETKQEAIAKAYELKIMNTVCKSEQLNSQILENIFSLNIIRLEDIYAKFLIEKDGIYIQFYDDNIVDEKFKLDLDWKKEGLKIKLNKKVKLFI